MPWQYVKNESYFVIFNLCLMKKVIFYVALKLKKCARTVQYVLHMSIYGNSLLEHNHKQLKYHIETMKILFR
jgi:hypothetical protein